MKIDVVIPTYNEAENLPRLVTTLLALPLNLSVLIVDDNSQDGTGNIADTLMASSSGRVNVLHRPEKLGLASAYIQGFQRIMKDGAEAVAQMDGDRSHDPEALISMAKTLESCDLVLGSRFTSGGSVDENWSTRRKVLSLWSNFYARSILKMPYRDVTSGYRLWRGQTILGFPWSRIRSNGYIFQVEAVYLAHCLKYNICEVPIKFTERFKGHSKMSVQIQAEAALRVWQMLLAYRDIPSSNRINQFKHLV